jgi:hypothetical protein
MRRNNNPRLTNAPELGIIFGPILFLHCGNPTRTTQLGSRGAMPAGIPNARHQTTRVQTGPGSKEYHMRKTKQAGTPEPVKKKAQRGKGAAKTAAKVTNAAPEVHESKKEIVLIFLRRPDGATLEELMSRTGWQAQSVRSFISGTVRKALGLSVTTPVSDDDRSSR